MKIVNNFELSIDDLNLLWKNVKKNFWCVPFFGFWEVLTTEGSYTFWTSMITEVKTKVAAMLKCPSKN